MVSLMRMAFFPHGTTKIVATGKGISCNNLTGHVTRLNLENQDSFDSVDSVALRGMIDPSICELQHLTLLDLGYNHLEGTIPKCIGSLGELIELRLSNNKLISSIPHTLGNLSNLQTLDLDSNHYLVANDLEWVSHLSNLRYLYLSFINLGRAVDWLSSINKIPSLIELYLDGCGLPQPQVNPNSTPHSFCQLKVLQLSSNKLSGQLSDYTQQLYCSQNSIKTLDLSDNPFNSGPVPDFSRLSSLNTLYLRNTSIVGPLPQSLGHLPNLWILDLSYNQLTGSLSLFNFAKLLSLESLFLSHNQLNGTFPYAIGQLPTLFLFDVSSNKLSGVISEAHLSNLSTLEVLDVSQNSLAFNLNSNWVPPFQLLELSATSCILGPKFPSWLKHQGNLMVLHIPNSGISDSFPEWFWNISSSLFYLNVSHNILGGVLPKSLPSIHVHFHLNPNYVSYEWDLSFNNLSGPLPHFPPQLQGLFLSNNMFSGFVSSFCATPLLNLTYLDLSSNLLLGQLPDCWEQYQRLRVLNLANNNLSRRIPKSFGTLQQIETIHLNNNNFSGAIPILTLCSNLKFIDFGDNNLQGIIPVWVGHKLHHLIVLRLRGNKFQGIIPTSLCKLLLLQVLDLSKNNIIGKIPQCLSDITALSIIRFPRENISYVAEGFRINEPNEMAFFSDKAILAWKGENREYGKNLGLMTIIDLSCNHLIGEIPHSITALVALASLNLSGNNLTGYIPNNIGHMTMLESLDLSRNYLYGRIPASLSNLTFLSYMNFSFNNLSGKIPQSTQLDTFDGSTYVGNNGLCGPPIKKQCPGDENSPNHQLPRSSDKNGRVEDELINFGFYVSLGFGFIVGFWGVCGTLFFKSSWRHAYYEFFNNINDWVHVQLVLFVARMKRRFQVQD